MRALSALIAVIGAIVPSSSVLAKSVVVDVRLSDGAKATRIAIAWASHANAADIRRVTLDAPGMVTVDLPGGLWNVTAEGKNIWAEPRSVDSEREDHIQLALRPAGTLVGRLDAQGMPARGAATVSLTAANAKNVVELTCPVESGVLRCPAPAGDFDVRLQVRPYCPVYFWNASVRRAEETSLGTLMLREGGSVVGWVETPSHSPAAATARLAPVGADPANGAAGRKLAAMELRSDTNKRGFFQVSGVPPGMYSLTVTSAGLAPSQVSPLEIRQGLEAHLREPIVLSPPLTLTLHLDPPEDPYHHPWEVSLARGVGSLPSSGGRWSHTVAADGSWKQEGLPAGQYLLIVGGSEESRWFKDEFPLDHSTTRSIRLSTLAVEGTLTDHGKPVAARIWFGGVSGNRRVRVESDEQGRFEGILPQEGRWVVDVQRTDGTTVALGAFDIAVPAGKERAVVDLELPGTEISGTVVSNSGEPVADAGIQVFTPTQRVTARSDTLGHFVVTGVPPGEVTIQADKDGRSSAPLSVTLAEKEPSAGLRLVLDDPTQLRGRVTARAVPVPGARVAVWPLTGMIQMTMTDVDGYFLATLPPGTTSVNVVVAAAGRPMHLGQQVVDPQHPLEIALSEVGGSLLLALRSREDLGRTFLQHDRAMVPLGLLIALAGASPVAGEQAVVTFEAVEPGAYALCVPAVQLCKSGTLLPSDRLRLDLTSGGVETHKGAERTSDLRSGSGIPRVSRNDSWEGPPQE